MIKIAVVGKIGAGKSYVAQSFGIPVFNADKEVSKIYEKNINFFKKLKKQIPKYIKSYPIKKREILKSPNALKHAIFNFFASSSKNFERLLSTIV